MDLFEWDNLKESAALSVSEFIEYINILVGKKKVVVEGEIAGYNVSQGKWVFFDLKEDGARVACFTMVFKLDIPLEDGMQIRVSGTPRVHQKSGRFSIFVDKVELCGQGLLAKQFEELKKKLSSEGLFAPERKRVLPSFPQTIGLVASRESAAYTDFMRILNQRWGGVTVVLRHTKVQGQGAEEDIVQAFEEFGSDGMGAQLIVLTRGGGSLEDLHAFNSEKVARAIFGCSLPVVCGVGHERDESLADYVADVRAATPTHAATLVVPDREEMITSVHRSEYQLAATFERSLEWYDHRVRSVVATLQQYALRQVHGFEVLFSRLLSQFDRFSVALSRSREHIVHAEEVIVGEFEQSLTLSHQYVESLERNLANMNPRTVLSRGYSIVRSGGVIVSSVKDVSSGDTIDLTLTDGDVSASVM